MACILLMQDKILAPCNRLRTRSHHLWTRRQILVAARSRRQLLLIWTCFMNFGSHKQINTVDRTRRHFFFVKNCRSLPRTDNGASFSFSSPSS